MVEQEFDTQVIKISPKVIGFRAIVRGKIYERTYMGYKPTEALKQFEQWLKAQNP